MPHASLTEQEGRSRGRSQPPQSWATSGDPRRPEHPTSRTRGGPWRPYPTLPGQPRGWFGTVRPRVRIPGPTTLLNSDHRFPGEPRIRGRGHAVRTPASGSSLLHTCVAAIRPSGCANARSRGKHWAGLELRQYREKVPHQRSRAYRTCRYLCFRTSLKLVTNQAADCHKKLCESQSD